MTGRNTFLFGDTNVSSLLLRILGLAAGAVVRGSAPRAATGGVTLEWFAVAPHALRGFHASHHDAHDADILINAMIRRGMHAEAREAQAALEMNQRLNPGCEIYAEVH